MTNLGRVVILNGPSRSGKTSIVGVMQQSLAEPWMNIGMDNHISATPPAYRPGIGLRPQARPSRGRAPQEPRAHHRPDPDRVPLGVLEDVVPTLYTALYESIAAHARLGLNVVADLYHHDFYSRPLGILPDCARRLRGLPVLFVGVLCPIDVIWQRREATWGQTKETVDDGVRAAVELHDRASRAHRYDLELDTSVLSPQECVEAIRARLDEGPQRSVLEDL